MSNSTKPIIYIHRVEWCPQDYYTTQANRDLLNQYFDVRDFGAHPRPVSHEELVTALRGAEGIILWNGAHPEEITLDAIQESGNTVKYVTVAHWWPGIEDMAKRIAPAGVAVIDASDACNQAVAEWALGALIQGFRNWDFYSRELKQGNWPTWRGARCGLLNGKTIGLVAVGRTGSWLLNYLAPFDVKVKIYDPGISPEQACELGVEKVDLDELMATCDAVSLHAPVLDATQDMIGKHELGLMKDGALLVNSARSHLVENEALKAELQSGRIHAVLDVFENEPIQEDEAYLFDLDNVVLTPHIAGTTDDMFERCGRFAIDAMCKRLQVQTNLAEVALS